jgi:hypothetical protein
MELVLELLDREHKFLAFGDFDLSFRRLIIALYPRTLQNSLRKTGWALKSNAHSLP